MMDNGIKGPITVTGALMAFGAGIAIGGGCLTDFVFSCFNFSD